MKPLMMVSIALLGFTTVAFAQNSNGNAPSNPTNREAPMNAPNSPVLAPCGAGPTTAGMIVADAKTMAPTDDRRGTLADLQCAGNTPLRTDAPASTTAAIAPDGK